MISGISLVLFRGRCVQRNKDEKYHKNAYKYLEVYTCLRYLFLEAHLFIVRWVFFFHRTMYGNNSGPRPRPRRFSSTVRSIPYKYTIKGCTYGPTIVSIQKSVCDNEALYFPMMMDSRGIFFLLLLRCLSWALRTRLPSFSHVSPFKFLPKTTTASKAPT